MSFSLMPYGGSQTRCTLPGSMVGNTSRQSPQYRRIDPSSVCQSGCLIFTRPLIVERPSTPPRRTARPTQRRSSGYVGASRVTAFRLSLDFELREPRNRLGRRLQRIGRPEQTHRREPIRNSGRLNTRGPGRRPDQVPVLALRCRRRAFARRSARDLRNARRLVVRLRTRTTPSRDH